MKGRLILAISIVLAANARAADPPSGARPTVLIVLIDDFGWGDPSCYGNALVKTPRMDRMAAEGVRFTQGYAAAPICSPSRCGLITGQFPARWKITSYLQTKAGNRACEMPDFLDPNAPSLPRMLQQAGYATAHIGKWHLGGGRDVTEAPKLREYGYDLGIGTWESPDPHPDVTSTNGIWAPSDKVKRHERTRWMVDKTLEFLSQNEGRPCFVNLWLDDTHTPFVPSEEQIEAAGPDDNAKLAKYRAVMLEMDRQIGRLLEGLPGDTLVLLLGDNGASPPFARQRGGGLRGSKLSLYEAGIRVPLIAWWPGVAPAGVVNDQTVFASVDVLPTLATLCGAKLPLGFDADGEVLAAAIKGKTPRRTKPLFWEYGRNENSFDYPKDARHRSPNLAVREGDWKLLVHADGAGAELYNLSVDRAETNNIAADWPEMTARLRELTLAWRASLP